MDVLVLIGRLLFSGVFLASALGHFRQANAMTGYAQSRGVPAARAAVLLGGILLRLGGASVLLGVWPDLGALLLVFFLVPTALLMHGLWKKSDPQAKQMEQVQFFTDLALAGAALMLLGLFAHLGDGLGLVSSVRCSISNGLSAVRRRDHRFRAVRPPHANTRRVERRRQ